MAVTLTVGRNMEVASTRMDAVMGNGLIALLKITKVETPDTATHLGPRGTGPLPCCRVPSMKTSILQMAINRPTIPSQLAEEAMAPIHGPTRQIPVRKIAPWTDFRSNQRNNLVIIAKVSATHMDHTLPFRQTTTTSKLSGEGQTDVRKPRMAEANT